MVIVTASNLAEDKLNPDPGVVWIVAWVRADEENVSHLSHALEELITLPEVLVMAPGTTWLARDVVVEEGVEGQPNTFRIRFSKARKIV